MWQDTVLAICQLAFVPSMIPTLRGSDKPALATSVMNAVIVSVIATTMATLTLWFAMTTAVFIACIWATLAVQKLRMDRPASRQGEVVSATAVDAESDPSRGAVGR